MSTYVPRTPPPLPTGPIVHRPVERRPSPFEGVRAAAPKTERQRLKAIREARKVLDELDARRNGIVREEHLEKRRVARTKTPKPPTERKPRRGTKDRLSDEQLLAYFAEGKSCLQIERLSGVPQRTIRSRAHAIGVHEFPTTRRSGPQITGITTEGMLQLRAQGLGWRSIAEHYGVSYVTIRRYRDKAGIDPNQKGTAA